MADIAVSNTPSLIFPSTDVYNFEAASGVDPADGEAVYLNTAGALVLSNAVDAGTAKFAGIVLRKQGRAYSVCRKGILAGFGVSALNVGAKLYLSNTAGALADAAGTVSKVAGVVVINNGVKCVSIDVDWNTLL